MITTSRYPIASFLLLICIISCTPSKMHINKLTALSGIQRDLQGHRGCRGLMPENTIPATLKALDLGVTTLEMDAVITKDKQVILSHEPFFNHEITTKPDGTFVSEAEEKNFNIYRMAYNEVLQYDVGLKPHPRFPKQHKTAAVKPLLATVIDSAEKHCEKAKRTSVYYNIETKSTPATDNLFHPEPAEFVELVVSVIKEKHIEERVIIQSFDVRTLQYLHRQYPSIKTALLVEDTITFAEQISKLGFTPTIYSPEYHLVNARLIEQCKAGNIKIIPWTVNTVQAIKKLIALGADGIITDYPDLK